MVDTKIQAIGIEAAGDETLLKKLIIQQKKLGPKDLLVEVKAVATNPVDCKHRDCGGAYFLGKSCTQENPLVLGYDAAGIVVECGSDVKYYKKGDEVFYAGSIILQGSNAQFQVVDERIVGFKPKSLNWSQAAAFPLVALTAWEAMFEKMTIKPTLGLKDNASKSILIIGGAGGVGCIAIQLAKQMGIGKVIATASRPDTVKFCQEMGADFVINHSKSLVEELLFIGIKEVDYMLVTCDITQKHIDEASKFIKFDGEICGITGFHNDLKLISCFTKRISLSVELMFAKAILQEKLDSQKEILDNVSKLIDDKKLKQIGLTSHKFNIENLKKAHQFQSSGTAIGKIVLEDVDVFFKSS